ncbi:proline-rich protein 2-like [Phacochoerus africanus]|uniref:proline-rich protein 2-like n=1 Tax=Phacochoerus africanus TaxID=41426 RepID=UPI001FDA3498|nr:proline-rich protein 2-like [Phacochoerus africanus]
MYGEPAVSQTVSHEQWEIQGANQDPQAPGGYRGGPAAKWKEFLPPGHLQRPSRAKPHPWRAGAREHGPPPSGAESELAGPAGNPVPALARAPHLPVSKRDSERDPSPTPAQTPPPPGLSQGPPSGPPRDPLTWPLRPRLPERASAAVGSPIAGLLGVAGGPHGDAAAAATSRSCGRAAAAPRPPPPGSPPPPSSGRGRAPRPLSPQPPAPLSQPRARLPRRAGGRGP